MTTKKRVFNNIKKRFSRRIETKNNYKKALRRLEKAFPKVFNLNKPKPLSHGIREQIFNAETGLSKKSIRKALTFYCNSHQYLKCMKEGVARYDLSGKATEISVTAEEAGVAYEKCSSLFVRIAEKNAEKKRLRKISSKAR